MTRTDALLIIALILLLILLGGCTTTSDIMPVADGTYTVSAYAAPARGGATGANNQAWAAAQAFCRAQGAYTQLVEQTERDVFQYTEGGYSGSSGSRYGYQESNSAAGAGSWAAGVARIHFICTDRIGGR